MSKLQYRPFSILSIILNFLTILIIYQFFFGPPLPLLTAHPSNLPLSSPTKAAIRPHHGITTPGPFITAWVASTQAQSASTAAVVSWHIPTTATAQHSRLEQCRTASSVHYQLTRLTLVVCTCIIALPFPLYTTRIFSPPIP